MFLAVGSFPRSSTLQNPSFVDAPREYSFHHGNQSWSLTTNWENLSEDRIRDGTKSWPKINLFVRRRPISPCIVLKKHMAATELNARELIPTRHSLITRLKNWEDQEGWKEFEWRWKAEPAGSWYNDVLLRRPEGGLRLRYIGSTVCDMVRF